MFDGVSNFFKNLNITRTIFINFVFTLNLLKYIKSIEELYFFLLHFLSVIFTYIEIASENFKSC